MADYKNNFNHRYQSNYERYQQYRNPRRNNQKQSKQTQMAYRFVIQILVAACVLMGVLVTKKMQDNTAWYEQIKTSLLSAFPYGKTNQAIEGLLGGYPTLKDDGTSTVGGLASGDYKQVMLTLQELKDRVVIRDYLDGVIIESEPGEPILSLVPGVVQFKNETKDTLNTIQLSLADDSILTVGFLENPQVSLYEHVKVNQPLGVGTPLEVDGVEMSYYYLALEVDGKPVDIIEYIDKIGSLGGLEQGSQESDQTDGTQNLVEPHAQTDENATDSNESTDDEETKPQSNQQQTQEQSDQPTEQQQSEE